MEYNLFMPTTRYTSDTSKQANAVQLDLWRSMSGQERVAKSMALSSRLRKMAFDAIRRQHPDWDERQVQLKFIELTYGKKLASEVTEWLLGRND